jgi:ribonuclease P protein component
VATKPILPQIPPHPLPLRFLRRLRRPRQSRPRPLIAYARPNNLPHPRLGISISRAVGTAPRRNRIKRLLREAFRLHQHDWPKGYDMVLVVRPHEPLILAEYQKLLTALMLKLHSTWQNQK